MKEILQTILSDIDCSLLYFEIIFRADGLCDGPSCVGARAVRVFAWELHAALFINPFWVPTQDNYNEWLENFSADFDLCWLIGGNYGNSRHTVDSLIMEEWISEEKTEALYSLASNLFI